MVRGRAAPGGQTIATGNGYDGHIWLWEVPGGKRGPKLDGHSSMMEAMTYSRDGKYLLSAAEDGLTRMWSMKERAEVFTLVTYDEDWLVITPDGRFDTSDLDHIPDFAWVFGDDPFHALAPEVFLRDYFEPRLVEKQLAGVGFRRVRPLADLNRRNPECASRPCPDRGIKQPTYRWRWKRSAERSFGGARLCRPRQFTTCGCSVTGSWWARSRPRRGQRLSPRGRRTPSWRRGERRRSSGPARASSPTRRPGD